MGFAKNTFFDSSVGNNWQIEQASDFDADGKADLLWRNSDGAFSTWESTGASFDRSVVFNSTVPISWEAQAHDYLFG